MINDIIGMNMLGKWQLNQNAVNHFICIETEDYVCQFTLRCRRGKINTFSINSYRKAARVIGDLTEDIEELAKAGKLTDIPGIGEGTAEKIIEYINTGKM